MKNGERQEKRRAPRVKREVIVQYRIKDVPHTGEFQVQRKPPIDLARTKDLAEKGLFFTASQPIFTQTILELKLQLPSERESIDLEGQVIDCEEIKKNFIYGVRVEFINVGEEKRDLLKRFVQLFLK